MNELNVASEEGGERMNQIAIMESMIEVLCKQLDAANDELSAIKEAHAQVIEERCPGDEVHCSCVPILRTEIDNLKCCGNCGIIASILCPKYFVGIIAENYNYWKHCYNWQSDALTRKDRE